MSIASPDGMEQGMSRESTIECLNALISICIDGERGFRRCADLADDATLKALLRNRADACAAAAAELQEWVAGHGGEPERTSSVGGTFHRRWIDVRRLFGERADLQLLEECERGEDVALEAYREALGAELSDGALALVEKQYEGVKKNREWLRNWRESLRTQS